MKLLKRIIPIFLIALFAGYLGAGFNQNDNTVTQERSTFDTVMDTGIIRCGYVIAHPALFKNPNTGDLSGVSYDAIEKMAENLSLKVEWVEEVGWTSMLEGLDNGRYDVMCTSVWSITSRALKADFLNPLWYAGVHVWVRSDDTRFDDINTVDWSKMTVAAIDGHISDTAARTRYPQAKTFSLTDLSQISEAFTAVATGKADATFEQELVSMDFLANNPNAVKKVSGNNPILVYPATTLIPRGEDKLKAMLNTAQDELMNSGYIDALITKYESYPNTLYKVARPYQ